MTPRRQEVGVVHDPESCCGCCGCGDTFLTSPTGFTKLGELAIAVVCQFLMLHYGVEYSDRLGIGYQIFLTCNSGAMMASFVFLLCYTVSTATYYRVRPSLFEVLFNLLCCALYIAASTLLLTSVFTELYYLYHTVSAFSAYPALTAVYVMGFAAGVLHLVDSILAFIFWRQQSSVQQQQ